jgi:hypothetical protein
MDGPKTPVLVSTLMSSVINFFPVVAEGNANG